MKFYMDLDDGQAYTLEEIKMHHDDPLPGSAEAVEAARRYEKNVSQMVSRLSGRSLLRQRVEDLRREAHDLEQLDKCLPLEMNEAADNELFRLLTR